MDIALLQNLSDAHLIPLGPVGKDFNLFLQKEIYEIASDL